MRTAREVLGLKLAEVGRLTAIPYRTLQDFEAGKNMPNLDRFARIAAVLGVSLDELYGWDEAKKE